MSNLIVLQRAFEAFVAHPCGHEMGELSRAAYEWAKEWRTTARPWPPAEPVERREATGGGIFHAPDSPLRPTGTGTGLASISNPRPQDDFARRYPPAAAPRPVTAEEDAILRQAILDSSVVVDRGRTVMLDSGPVRPTNPAEDAGDMA